MAARRKPPRKPRVAPRVRSAPDWACAFLEALEGRPNISRACRAAGITRATFYSRRDTDQAFAAAVRETLEEAVDGLVERAWLRAEVDSDQLMMFLLKAHRREVYGDKLSLDTRSTLSIVEEIVDAPAPGTPDQAAPGAGGVSA